MGKRAKLNILLIGSRRTVHSWNDAIKNWLNVIKDAKGEGKAAEECEYARVTEGEDSFIELMLAANDTIARLKAQVTLISRKRESNDRLRAMTLTQSELQPII